MGRLWAEHPKLHSGIQKFIEEFWEINRDTASPKVTWDAFKASLRGEYISRINGERRAKEKKRKDLENTERNTDKEYADNPTTENFTALQQA